jgi:prefoldin subunit 5
MVTEKQHSKKISVNEHQLMQMAQQEESTLNNKHAMFEKITHMLKETIIAKEILTTAQTNKGKVMFSIGATVLIEGQITNTEKCKRALADNAYKEDSFEETIKWLTKKEEQVKQQMQKLQTEMNASQNKLTNYIGLLKQIDVEKKKMLQIKKQSPPSLSK